MRKPDLALSFLAIAAVAFVTLSAQATPLPVPPKTYSSVDKIGCRGPGAYCPGGRHWVCDLYRCRCAPCAYGAPRLIGVGAGCPRRGSERFGRSSCHGYALRRAR